MVTHQGDMTHERALRRGFALLCNDAYAASRRYQICNLSNKGFDNFL